MDSLRYTIIFKCFTKPEANLIHQTNDYDQADHFVWAMITKLKGELESWQLTLEYQECIKHPDKPDTFETRYQYNFSRN